MAVAFNKFNQFVEDVAKGVHDFSSDTFAVGLSNALPSASADEVIADVTLVSTANLSTQNVSIASAAQTAGVMEISITDLVLTSTGGATGPFQYVVLYNGTPSSPTDPVIGWWTLDAPVTLNDGESLTLNFADTTLQLS